MWKNVDEKGEREREDFIGVSSMKFFSYRAREFYEKNNELKQALDQINSGYFSPEDPGLFNDVVNSLLNDHGDQ